jgi:molybdopterin molybdotransferase
MNPSPRMVSLEQAQASIDRTLGPLALEHDRVPTRDALGRLLAADYRSRLDQPPFDKSAMDGYAIPPGGSDSCYVVVDTIAAGEPAPVRLAPGTAVKVMTGAPVPQGTARVVPVELVRRRADTIEILGDNRQTHVCPQGEDLRRGDLVLRAGSRIRPVDVANLVAAGHVEVDVLRRIRMSVFSTGEEIVDDPVDLRPGRIMNSNGPLLAALARQWGLEVIAETRLPDDRAQTAAALASAWQRADVVVLSGGVSAGDFDFVGPALADAGLQVHFDAVATKPGKPTTYASLGNKAVFALPGNPVAVLLCFHLYVLRGVARLCGTPWPVRRACFPLADEFCRRTAERQEYVPCRIDEGGRLVRLEFHGSGHLAALGAADGMFIVPVDCSRLPAGQPVGFLPLGTFAP